MSLDAEHVALTKLGKVIVHPEIEGRVQIVVEDFEGSRNCSCRDVAVLACLWAIGELTREVTRNIEKPGGGAIGID